MTTLQYVVSVSVSVCGSEDFEIFGVASQVEIRNTCLNLGVYTFRYPRDISFLNVIFCMAKPVIKRSKNRHT